MGLYSWHPITLSFKRFPILSQQKSSHFPRSRIHMDVSKNRRKTPKMDGEKNGKPYYNGWFGGKHPYFWKHPYNHQFFPWKSSTESSNPVVDCAIDDILLESKNPKASGHWTVVFLPPNKRWKEIWVLNQKYGQTHQIIHLFIGFSIIFTIHFGGQIPLFLVQHPYRSPIWNPQLSGFIFFSNQGEDPNLAISGHDNQGLNYCIPNTSLKW